MSSNTNIPQKDTGVNKSFSIKIVIEVTENNEYFLYNITNLNNQVIKSKVSTNTIKS